MLTDAEIRELLSEAKLLPRNATEKLGKLGAASRGMQGDSKVPGRNGQAVQHPGIAQCNTTFKRELL